MTGTFFLYFQTSMDLRDGASTGQVDWMGWPCLLDIFVPFSILSLIPCCVVLTYSGCGCLYNEIICYVSQDGLLYKLAENPRFIKYHLSVVSVDISFYVKHLSDKVNIFLGFSSKFSVMSPTIWGTRPILF